FSFFSFFFFNAPATTEIYTLSLHDALPICFTCGCRAVLEYTVFFCIRRVFVAENRVMTLRLEPELRKRLDGLAKAQRRSRSFIAAEAIRQYVAVNEWQIEEISKGMAEADRGEFASDEQVRHTMN